MPFSRESLLRGWRAGADKTVTMHVLVAGSNVWSEHPVCVEALLSDSLTMELAPLRDWLAGVRSTPVDDSWRWICGFKWSGEALFCRKCMVNIASYNVDYERDELDNFVAMVTASRPNIAAKEMELQMAKRIAEHVGVGTGEPAVPAEPTRRRTKVAL